MTRPYRIVSGFFLFCCLFLFTDTFAASIKDLNFFRDENNDVLLSARLEGAFTKEITEAIDSGAPVSFTYYVTVKQHRRYWTDKNRISKVIKKIVKYDSFNKEYHVVERIGESESDVTGNRLSSVDKVVSSAVPMEETPLGEGAEEVDEGQSEVVAKSDQLKEWMSTLDNIYIGSKKDFSEDHQYYVQVKATMKSINLPRPFNYILFFVSFWDFDTSIQSSPLFHGAPPENT
jgi:hypothetical protein